MTKLKVGQRVMVMARAVSPTIEEQERGGAYRFPRFSGPAIVHGIAKMDGCYHVTMVSELLPGNHRGKEIRFTVHSDCFQVVHDEAQ